MNFLSTIAIGGFNPSAAGAGVLALVLFGVVGFIAGLTAWVINARINLSYGLISQSLGIIIAIGTSLYIFCVIAKRLQVDEVMEIIKIVREKFIHLPK